MGLTERRGGWDTILPFVVSGRRHPEGSGAGEGAMFPDLFRDDVFRIETRRLWLRWPTARDAETLRRLAADPEVGATMAGTPGLPDRANEDAFIVALRAGNAAGTGLTLALCERARPGRPLGLVGIGPSPGDEAGRLFGWLGRPFRGDGLMSEAAGAVVQAWFAWAGGARLDAQVRSDAPAARRVLEKAGFVPAEADRLRLDRGRWLSGAADERPALAAAE